MKKNIFKKIAIIGCAIICTGATFFTTIPKEKAKAEEIEQLTYQTGFNNYFSLSAVFRTNQETIPVMDITNPDYVNLPKVQYTGNFKLLTTGNKLNIFFEYTEGTTIKQTSFKVKSTGQGNAKITIFESEKGVGWATGSTNPTPSYKLDISLPNTGQIFSIQGNNIYVTTEFKPTELYMEGGNIFIACSEEKNIGTTIRILGFNAGADTGNNIPFRQPAMSGNLYAPLRVYERNSQALQDAYNNGLRDGTKDKNAYGTQQYNKGYAEGTNAANNYSFENLIFAVIDAPIQSLYGLLNFDLLGVNILNLFLALLTTSIMIFILKKVL